MHTCTAYQYWMWNKRRKWVCCVAFRYNVNWSVMRYCQYAMVWLGGLRLFCVYVLQLPSWNWIIFQPILPAATYAALSVVVVAVTALSCYSLDMLRVRVLKVCVCVLNVAVVRLLLLLFVFFPCLFLRTDSTLWHSAPQIVHILVDQSSLQSF